MEGQRLAPCKTQVSKRGALHLAFAASFALQAQRPSDGVRPFPDGVRPPFDGAAAAGRGLGGPQGAPQVSGQFPAQDLFFASRISCARSASMIVEVPEPVGAPWVGPQWAKEGTHAGRR
eukprot:366398-Chlamydomonas_euryale.AAC.9